MAEGKPIAEWSSQETETKHWPTALNYDKAQRVLRITYDTGETFELTAELLRVESPSAEVQGHGPGQKQTIAGRAHVGIMEIEPVGNYAVKIKFDDLHDTGIFSWQYLFHLGSNQHQIWQNYLDSVAEKGLSREPKRGR